MKCKKCGKIMVEANPNIICASNPPCVWMICKCGHRTTKTIGQYITSPKSWQERWEKENE